MALAPLDPVGFFGVVPVAVCLGGPADVGGELALIMMEVGFPKQTLSLALGVKKASPNCDPPEVVSSLDRGKKAPELGPFF